MRTRILSMAVVLCTALLGFVGAAHAQNQTFLFRICNASAVPAAAAVTSRVSPTDNRWVVRGWWIVNAGDCANIGNFPKGWIYFYAEQKDSGQIYWGGSAVQLCITYPGPFERINTTGFTCENNELKGFDSEQVGPGTGTFTWTLR